MKRKGFFTELRSAAYLRRRGFTVLKTRYRAGQGEIDLIALDKGTTCFIEIKQSKGLGDGQMRVNAEKRARIRSAAKCWLLSHPTDSIRFDVLEESDAGFLLIKNAF